MRTYNQYCPIARASEVLAQRWTPIILRNMLLGSSTFSAILDGAPGISRTLLTKRLRELERVGVVETAVNPGGRGSLYRLTDAGRDLSGVMAALGAWGERWMELAPEHLDPGVVLHSWCTWYLATERLPERRVVARFDFSDLPKRSARLWVIFEPDRAEVCLADPGYEIDLFVESESRTLAEWHLGRIEWGNGLRDGRIRVRGPSSLTRALPTWNHRSAAAQARQRASAGR